MVSSSLLLRTDVNNLYEFSPKPPKLSSLQDLSKQRSKSELKEWGDLEELDMFHISTLEDFVGTDFAFLKNKKAQSPTSSHVIANIVDAAVQKPSGKRDTRDKPASAKEAPERERKRRKVGNGIYDLIPQVMLFFIILLIFVLPSAPAAPSYVSIISSSAFPRDRPDKIYQAVHKVSCRSHLSGDDDIH